jgi:uncharacterized glyoxalase superfamily protein PhnB
MKIPSQYLPVMPYLIVSDAKGLASFVKNVFNASEQMIVPKDDGKIMHGELRMNDAVIMFADATEEWKTKPAGMFVYVENVQQVYERAMQQGAINLMEPQQREYGYSAGFEDVYGNQWWLAQAE